MNYHNILRSGRDGTGMRVVLYVSGCDNACKGCQNPETWDCNSGIPFDEQAKAELFSMLDDPWISGLTLSGGDPMFMTNRKEIGRLVKEVKDRFPNKTIWLYTGKSWKYVRELNLDWLELIDVICDGKFAIELRNVDTRWVGSSNQKVIDVKASLNNNSIVLFEEGGKSDGIERTVIKSTCGC